MCQTCYIKNDRYIVFLCCQHNASSCIWKNFCFFVHRAVRNTVLIRVCLFAGLDHWTGLLDWTTGLIFDGILSVLCQLNNNSYYGVEHFLVSEASTTTTNYTTIHGVLQSCKRPSGWLVSSRYVAVCRICLFNLWIILLIAFLYLKQVQQLQTMPMPTAYGDYKPVHFTQFSCEDGYAR